MAAAADRHKDQPKAVRFPDGLRARIQAAAEAAGETENGFIVTAALERLARFEAPPPAAGIAARAEAAG